MFHDAMINQINAWDSILYLLIINIIYTHVQWKRTTYKNDYIFLTTKHFIFAIVSYCTVAIP